MRRSRELISLLLVMVTAAACVSPNDPGVAVENIEADLVFGIEEAPEAVLPANTNPGPIPDGSLDTAFDMSRFRNPAADRLPPLGASDAVDPCPAAPPTAAAEVPAEASISGPVREGVYVWQREGSQITPNPTGGEPVTQKISGFEKRIIRNVQPYDDPFDPDAYTFEMVQTLVDRPVLQVRTFLVKPLSSGQLAPDAGSTSPVDEPTITEPEAGISLIKVEEETENGEGLGTFEPATGLLMLGLPVAPSLAFQSQAIDPKSGQAIAQDGVVRGRARIDACGDLVDGWRVETNQTRSDVAGQVAYNFVIATQYGGVPILEEVSTVNADGIETNVIFTLGQLHPDPLEGDA